MEPETRRPLKPALDELQAKSQSALR
jgi:hypothetical protein